MKERNTNIEILRLLCMIAIFGWHILVHDNESKKTVINQVFASFSCKTIKLARVCC